MVYKVSKGGVRSGNTLRGLNTRRTKRYSLHGCLVNSSNLGTKQFNHVITKNAADLPQLQETLTSTGVELSLNKKQRWQIPATIAHMIKSGGFDPRGTFSLLERHKLKRRANCIKFLSNNARIHHVEPRQKRYFSYNLDSNNADQSKRQLRKIFKVKNKKVNSQKISIDPVKKSGLSHVKTVRVFTSSHHSSGNMLDSSKPEYRTEVFYPCPQTCSLTFNPKYTDVTLVEGESGDLEVKSNTTEKNRRGKQHRRRNINKYVDDDMDRATIDSDVQKMWMEEQYQPQSFQNEESTALKENKCEGEHPSLKAETEPEDVFDPYNKQESDTILSLLITQAERTSKLCRKGNSKKSSKNKKANVFTEAKSNIVYVPWTYANEIGSCKSAVSSEKTGLDKPAPSDSQTNNKGHFRVILAEDETLQAELKNDYGQRYSEGNCMPRRFVLNVTDDVTNVLCATKSSKCMNTPYLSFLVFTYDSPLANGFDAYRVTFNSYIGLDKRFFYQNFPFQHCSISEIMNHILNVLLDLKSENQLQIQKPFVNKPEVGSSFVHDTMKINFEVFKTSDEISMAINRGEVHEEVALNYNQTINGMNDVEFDKFCEICYTNVNPTHSNSATGTELRKCGHHFCDSCWRTHFRTKMRNGSFKMTCPAYSCDTVIGPVTLISLLHVTEVGRLFQCILEEMLEHQENVVWCPNAKCSHMIKMNGRASSRTSNMDVKCVCGESFCLHCMGPPHWPAKCEQAEEYSNKLRTLQLPKDTEDGSTAYNRVHVLETSSTPDKIVPMVVHGRTCPNCDKFIDKNGGCPNVTCKCGFTFCWTCMKASYHFSCILDPVYIYKHTRRLVVHHNVPKSWNEDKNDSVKALPTSSSSTTKRVRQKICMYKRALQQRIQASVLQTNGYVSKIRDLKAKIVKHAMKDTTLKKEILTLCRVNPTPEDLDSLNFNALSSHVTKFLTSFLELTQSLQHVVEFTMVLLQNTRPSVERHRLLKIADDLSGFCSFLQSVLDAGDKQDAIEAARHLVEIRDWCKGALDALLATTCRL